MAEADNSSPKFQRRTIIIKRTLQLKYVAMVFFSALLASLLVGLDVYYTMAKLLLPDNPSMGTVVSQFSVILGVKIVLYLVIILLISIYVSHRFAGPIHRFEKSAQIVSSGDLTHRVSLRIGDELMELQEEFNGMLASLQSLVQKDRTLALHIGEKLSATIKNLPENPQGEALRKDLSSLKMELEHLTQSFRV